MVVSSPRLLRTLKPKADESFLGYIARLTEHNGYDSPSWIMQMVNINHSIFGSLCPFLSSSSESLSLLANLTGTELSALVQLTYQRVDHWSSDYYSFFGYPIPRYYIRPNPPKTCPKCLREAAYCRRVWELTFITATNGASSTD